MCREYGIERLCADLGRLYEEELSAPPPAVERAPRGGRGASAASP